MNAIRLVVVLFALLSLGAPARAPAAAAPRPDAPPIDPGTVVGGVEYACPLLGILLGVQMVTGNAVGALGTIIAADMYGCL